MSERTAASLAILDRFNTSIGALPETLFREQILAEAKALRDAVAAFHMEAIRFRMFSVDRLLRVEGSDGPIRQTFEDLRDALETAGFHTRSHTAP